ncbi:MAG: glycosyltransferase [Vicinamibacterales bacterium]
MRLLLVHCRYRQKGGEDAVFDTEAAQLAAAGHQVERLEFHNDDIVADTFGQRLRAGLETVWATDAPARLATVLRDFRPEVAHFHNTFPRLSPRAYRICRTAGVPVVQTLHNYRTVCAGAMLMRNGAVCERCLGGHFFHGVRHACYRQSRLASSAVVAMQYLHHAIGTFSDCVDTYVALTAFARDKYIAGGLPAARIVVKPNSLARDPGEGTGEGGFVLYVGRLAAEKGIRTLLRAWESIGDTRLVIAGDGPMSRVVQGAAAVSNGRIQALGLVTSDVVERLMGEAVCLVMPSEWYEGFPMTAVEAYARGLPLVASRIGSLAEIVVPGTTGALFEPGDAAGLAQTVRSLVGDRSILAACRRGARERFVSRFSANSNVVALHHIYLAARRGREAA